MTESEIKAYIASEVAAQLQAITSKDIASESGHPYALRRRVGYK